MSPVATALPRVTDILRDAGLVDTSFFSDYHRDRGTAVHAACVLLSEGELAWETVADACHARVMGFNKFLEEMKPEVIAAEEEVVNEELGYVGHLDFRMNINGKSWVIDVKPPSQYPWQRIQLMLYCMCFVRPWKRGGLHLQDNGDYRLIEHTDDRTDRKVALCAITIANWKRNLCLQKS